MIWFYEKINNVITIYRSSAFKIKDLNKVINVLNKDIPQLKHLLEFCVSVRPLIVIKRNL